MMRGLGEQMFKTLLVSIAIGGLRLAAADVPRAVVNTAWLGEQVAARFGSVFALEVVS